MLEPKLTAQNAKSHVSVARMTDYWYAVCRSQDLRRGAVRPVTLLGTPLVLFRNAHGDVGALLDRCPHRNVPLSRGRVAGGNLRCSYHGWEFGSDGGCRAIPGLLGESDTRGHAATAHAVREQDTYIWVYGRAGVEPSTEPFRLSLLSDNRYTHAHRKARAQGSLHATIENALDVPHTAFLHRGLFRGGTRNQIDVKVRRWSDRCEAEYIGEPRPEGLAARLLAPSGGEVKHVDRFFLPSVAQVDYALGDDTHIVVTSLCLPISDFDTELFAVVSFRLGRVPGWVVKPLLEPLGRAIFAQDARMLKAQTEVIQRFGGEQYTSTEIDVLGPEIWRLMKAAQRGKAAAPGDEPLSEKSLTMTV